VIFTWLSNTTLDDGLDVAEQPFKKANNSKEEAITDGALRDGAIELNVMCNLEVNIKQT
jgi:hypothetical protein